MHASVRPALSVNIPQTGTNTAARESAAALSTRMAISKVNLFYGNKQTLFDISMGIATNKVTALIGPSGCGKSTLLRTLNRMHETVRGARLEGEIVLDGNSIFGQDVTSLRRRVGMVFQRPNPFPKSIFDNVAYGLRINGSKVPIADRDLRTVNSQPVGHVVEDRLGKRVGALEDHADAAAKRSHILAKNAVAIQNDLALQARAAHRFVHAVESAEKRGLPATGRSEEHTSELQSRLHLV